MLSTRKSRFGLFVCFLLFRAEPVACGGSQARGQIGAIAPDLQHSHSNAESKLCLQPTHRSQKSQILNPLSKARD